MASVVVIWSAVSAFPTLLGAEVASLIFLESPLLGGRVVWELMVIIMFVMVVMWAKAASKWSSLAWVAVSHSFVALLNLDSKVDDRWSVLVVSAVRAPVGKDAAAVVWLIIAAIIARSRLVCPKAVLKVMIERLLLLLVWMSWASVISIAGLISRLTSLLRLREAASITWLELIFGRIWWPTPASISHAWRIPTLADWIVSRWPPSLTHLLEAGLR